MRDGSSFSTVGSELEGVQSSLPGGDTTAEHRYIHHRGPNMYTLCPQAGFESRKTHFLRLLRTMMFAYMWKR